MHPILTTCALLIANSGTEAGPTAPFVASATSQYVTFEAAVHDGPSVLDPTTNAPVVGLKTIVIWKDTTTGGTTITTEYADALGRIAVPPSKKPETLLVSGPASLDVDCRRQIEYPSGSGTTTSVSPTWTVDLKVDPPTYTPEGIAGGFTSAELEAYLHVQRAFDAFESLTGGSATHLSVLFLNLGDPQFNSPSYVDSSNVIWVFYGAGTTDDAIWARSRSTMSHETAHHFMHGIFGSAMQFPPLDRMDEGSADFLATIVSKTPLIGAGCNGPGTYLRTLDNQAQYTLNPDPDPHVGGLVIGGALYHTRQGFKQKGPAALALFDARLAQLYAAKPKDEDAALLAALKVYDDDADLSNGTPNAPQFHTGFYVRHAVPWPLAPVPPNAPPGGLNGVVSPGQIGCGVTLGLFDGPALGRALVVLRAGTPGERTPTSRTRPLGLLSLDEAGQGTLELARPLGAALTGATVEVWVANRDGTPFGHLELELPRAVTER